MNGHGAPCPYDNARDGEKLKKGGFETRPYDDVSTLGFAALTANLHPLPALRATLSHKWERGKIV